MDSRNTHEKQSGPTKYLREKILDSRNTHEKKFWTDEGTVAQWYETRDGARTTEFSTPHHSLFQ